MKKIMIIIISFLIFPILAQNQPMTSPGTGSGNAGTTSTSAPKLIDGEFRNVTLGMEREEVLDLILKDGLLEIDEYSKYGDFDEENKNVLKARSLPQISNIFYQFYKDENTDKYFLYTITIHFNPKYFTFFELYQTLFDKYGKAENKIPNKSEWGITDKNGYKMILSKTGYYPRFNITLKYIDKEGLKKATKKEAVPNIKSKKDLLKDSL